VQTIVVLERNADRNHGGAQKSMSEFVDFVGAKGFKICLICTSYVHYSHYVERVEIIPEIPPIRNLKAYAFLAKKIYSIVDSLQAPLIITHWHEFLKIGVILELVYSMRVVFYFKWIPTKKISNIEKIFLRLMPVKIAGFANAEMVSKYYKDFINVECEVIINGCPKIIESKVEERNKDALNFLFVGRIYHGKGLHLILEECKSLTETWELNVVGEFQDSDYHRMIEDLIKELNLENNVRFFGHQSDVSKFYSAADVVFVPSIAPEAGPRVFMEAASIGKPCLVSENCGILAKIPLNLREKLCFDLNEGSMNRILRQLLAMDILTWNQMRSDLQNLYDAEMSEDMRNVRLLSALINIRSSRNFIE